MNDPIQRLILELARLPGIGERSAARLAYYVIKQSQGGGPGAISHDLAQALTEVTDSIRLCQICQNFTTEAECSICRDPERETTSICVVESVADLRAIESSGAYRGRYHVLHGALSPLEGVGPDDLKIAELERRLDGTDHELELILATSADVEGDATALYLAKRLESQVARVTRLASGIPLGGELEYVDRGTLGRALAERRDFN